MDKNLQKLITESQRITVLTGAGISISSGLKSFQCLDEDWPFKASRETMLSLSYFLMQPKRFCEAFQYIFSFQGKLTPTPFHMWLAELEEKAGKYISIFTQNVDSLHQAAGSTQVTEMHGNSRELYCLPFKNRGCGLIISASLTEIIDIPICPSCGNNLKPNMALFGEAITGFEEARKQILASDLLIVAGTALNVFPVRDLPLVASSREIPIPSLWINPSLPPAEFNFTYEQILTSDDFAALARL
jgi:NAD-dependent deacetylase